MTNTAWPHRWAAIHRRAVAVFLFLSAFGLIAAPSPAQAVDPAAARAFVQQTAEEVLGLIRRGGSSSAQRSQVRSLLSRKGALSDVARVAIGQAWSGMSADQRQRYVNAFGDMIAKQTVDGFQDYAGETIRVTGAVDQGRSGVFVNTVIDRSVRGQTPVSVDWRIIDRNGPLQLFDVYVDGVSLLTTQRQTFAERLDRLGGDVDAFIASLEAEGS